MTVKEMTEDFAEAVMSDYLHEIYDIEMAVPEPQELIDADWQLGWD